MNQTAKRLATITLLTFLALILLWSFLPTQEPQSEPPGLARLADVGKLQGAYQNWKVKHEQYGGDRNVVIGLGYSRGLSAQFTQAQGAAKLDLIGASVNVEVHGLDDEVNWDVWLIDNRPGPGHSVIPEPGDLMLNAGRLIHEGEVAKLDTDLGADALLEFQVDLMVVAREGHDPGKRGVLFGSSSLFQRLYTLERSEQLAMVSDYQPSNGMLAENWWTPLLGLRKAFASTIVDPDVLMDGMVARGADIYFNETFNGNGRTCATCHPASNNFTIDPTFIATLPKHDPLFVAEFVEELKENFEKPKLMRSAGLILENLDGFDDLENRFVMRGVPHVLAMSTSLEGLTVPFDNTFNPAFGIFPPAEKTGWSGDGAPGEGSLRSFTTGAVIQHFPLTLNRCPAVIENCTEDSPPDFRLPDDAELDAVAAFLRALGRPDELDINSMNFTNPKVEEGRDIFIRPDTEGGTVAAGKCALCHNNAGANIDSEFFTQVLNSVPPGLPPGLIVSGNANFGTGVNDLEALPGDLIDPENPAPRDGGFARVLHSDENCTDGHGGFGTVTPEGGALPAGLCEEDFNTPTLVEAADTAPFFHNNAVDTLEGAITFYNDDAFNGSAGGTLLAMLDSGSVGIKLDSSQVTSVASFLRVLNALENIRSAAELLKTSRQVSRYYSRELLKQGGFEAEDAIQVLFAAGLHPGAVAALKSASTNIDKGRSSKFRFYRDLYTRRALAYLGKARANMVNGS